MYCPWTPRLWKLSWSDVSSWTWDQRHGREQHACFLPRFTIVDQYGCQLHTTIYDKRDDFNFLITNFPFLGRNIPFSPAYKVFISQIIHIDMPGMTILGRKSPENYQTRHLFEKRRCPRRQQSQNIAIISKSYIFHK